VRFALKHARFGENMSENVISMFGGDKTLPNQDELAWAFPEVESGQSPFGGRVIVQLRRIKQKYAGKIVLVEETKENEKWNNMIGKVVAIGPLAFKNRDTMQPWPEGTWAEIGDYVRVPKWGGDRWERPVTDDEDPVLFMTINDHELIAKVTDNPLSFKAFV
jgi:co-chaperonin GroES (HSP10)